MDEAKAREIHNATDLSQYTHNELSKADHWVKMYAIDKLRLKLMDTVEADLRAYVMICVRAYYGSVETDILLRAYKCYPDWVK